jgi:hypothetical protein
MKHIKLFDNFTPISENLNYHIDNNIPILENIFRPHSTSFYNLISEARELFDNSKIEICNLDRLLFETTDLGLWGRYKGEMVPLDLPMENIEEINEAEYKGKEVKLNKPMRSSGPKKYKVYVKNPKTGRVKVVNFGDVKGGLTAKINDSKARRSFSARHNCASKKNKMQAGYWSCRLTKFPHLFSSNKTYAGFW